MTFHEPPSGWYTFGTHAGWDHDDMPRLEFSEESGEDGMPLFERPLTAEPARDATNDLTYEERCDLFDAARDTFACRNPDCPESNFEGARQDTLTAAVERIVATRLAAAWDRGLAAGSALASHPDAARLTPLNPYRAALATNPEEKHMTDEPARDATNDLALTEAERSDLHAVFEEFRRGRFTTAGTIYAAVERIVADRLAAQPDGGCVPCRTCGGDQTRGWHLHDRVTDEPARDTTNDIALTRREMDALDSAGISGAAAWSAVRRIIADRLAAHTSHQQARLAAVEADARRLGFDVALAREVIRRVGDLGGKALSNNDPETQRLGHDICEQSLRAWRITDAAFKRTQRIRAALATNPEEGT